jgi:Ulp1 family protease
MFKLLRTVPVNFHFKITKNYHSVKKWAKQDIFTKDFVVIPVNMPRHWSLIIVLRLPGLIDPKYGKPQIIYLDSMGEKNKSIIEAVRM